MAHDSVRSYKQFGIICPYEKFVTVTVIRYRTSAYPSTPMRNQCEMSINFLTCEGACNVRLTLEIASRLACVPGAG